MTGQEARAFLAFAVKPDTVAGRLREAVAALVEEGRFEASAIGAAALEACRMTGETVFVQVNPDGAFSVLKAPPDDR